MQLDITVDTSDLERRMGFLAREQMPFIGAMTLTQTAKDAQQVVIVRLPHKFTIRNTWTQKGVQIQPAKKNHLESRVMVRDDYMQLQEEGGTKTPRGQHLAIPARGARKNKRDIITKSNRPRAVLDRPKSFIQRLKSGREAIMRRKGKSRFPVEVMFLLIPKAEINARFGFEETVRRTVTDRVQKNFETAFNRAMATAR